MEFAYVTFVNYNCNYIELMKSTIDSVLKFSKYKIIVYCIDFPVNNIFIFNKNIILKYLNNINLPNIHYYKPYIIKDSIENGLQHGYYIESDDIITPLCDALYEKAQKLDTLPISPIHPNNVKIPQKDINVIDKNIIPTQPYTHGHVLFKHTNINFINEWLEYCIKQKNYLNDDETVLNILYWKYNCKDHYLDIIDPWYECFYNDIKYREISCTFHGCKDHIVQRKLLDDLIYYYDFKNNKIDIVVINLESRPDRFERIQKYFTKYSYLNLIRFNAYNENINNTINCGLSHYYAFLKYVIEQDFVIIMEDDNKPLEYFDILFPKVYNYLKNNLNKWDYVNLSSSTVNCFGWIRPSLELINTFYDDNIPLNSGLYNSINTSANNFVCYNKSMLKYFKNYIINIKQPSSIYDKLIHMDQMFGNYDLTQLKRLVLYPIISIQEKDFSNITNSDVDYEKLYSICNISMKNYIENKYKYLTIKLKGGLGNQLFQIYSSMYLANKYNMLFILENKLYTSEYPDTLRSTYYNNFLQELELYNNDKFNWKYLENIEDINKDNNYMIEGYYQDYNIFEDYSTEISNKLLIKDKIEKCYYKYLPEYDFNGIACHFRLGDYKHKQDDHPILDIEYYTKCFDILNIKDKTITVFCEKEDKEYLQSILKISNIKFISDDIPDYEQLLLISKFKYIIISNSTFSWWSAYFASTLYSNNNIYIPYKWFNEEIQKELIYKNWNVITW